MKFSKINNKVVIVHYGNVINCPPVLNVCEALVNNGIKTHLISGTINNIKNTLITHPLFTFSDLGNFKTENNYIDKIKKRANLYLNMRREFCENMDLEDIVWTTNEVSVMFLNNLLKPYHRQHVMQLMELINYCPISYQFPLLKFPIQAYARQAWKTVVPEINRAYIQKVEWNLNRTPYILPNKSYYLQPGPMSPELTAALDIMKNEKRKIILYMGIFSLDRDMEPFINALGELGDEYCLIAIGRISEVMESRKQHILENSSNFRYLGFYKPPDHLHFLQYAHIGLTPYKPSHDIKYVSPLNSLYCAPNKIFEYAGYGIPMIGTDVLGLRTPFERYNIGICCSDLSPNSIANAIKIIERNYNKMSKNCIEFYNSVHIDKIINNIIYDD